MIIRISYLMLLTIVLFTSCNTPDNISEFPDPDLAEANIVEQFGCDAESLSEDNAWFISDGQKFSNGLARTDDFACSGEYSLKLDTSASYGFECIINNVSADDFFIVKVKRKINPENNGYIVASDLNENFLVKGGKVTDTISDEWEQVVLKFHVTPLIKSDTLRIYIRNPDTIPVYFDDIEILRLKEDLFPEYDEPYLQLLIDTAGINKLKSKREVALEAGLLQAEKDDWVAAKMIYKKDSFDIKLRLKGDWLGHLDGEKWSFRINIKGQSTWNGLKEFSIHNPEARYFLHEWILHKILDKEDVLTTSYGFVPVRLNGKSLGYYAWEEHFTKLLVESRKRREGPIVRFSEDVFWEVMKDIVKDKSKFANVFIPKVEASPVVPYSLKKTIANPILYRQFGIAQNLMHQYKYSKKNASQIFDIDKLARYFALLNLTRGYHTLTWHNQRFYFNPITNRLEPIVYDSYTEKGIYNMYPWKILGDIFPSKGDNNSRMKVHLFADKKFVKKYIHYLEIYSNENYAEDVFSELKNEAKKIESLIQLEYPDYRMSIEHITNSAADIRTILPAYKKKVETEKYYSDAANQMCAHNYHSYYTGTKPGKFVFAYHEPGGDSLVAFSCLGEDITLYGIGNQPDKPDKIFRKVYRIKAQEILEEPSLAVIKIKADFGFLFFKIKGQDTIYNTTTISWPSPVDFSPDQELTENAEDITNEQFLFNEDEKRVSIKGKHIIDRTVNIPEGYNVNFEAGTELDLIKGASFISRSPVFFEGKQESPVKVFSSDGTAKGFIVLQADKRSVINHTHFENLNTMNYKGWVLTGAITFYESDVDFDNTKITRSNCEDALNIIRSDFNISNSEISETYSDAFDADFCTGSLNNLNIHNTADDGIDFSGSTISATACIFNNIGDKAISIGENSQGEIINTDITKAKVAVAVKDKSDLKINGISIRECEYGIAAFIKKHEFGPAAVTIENCKPENIEKLYLIEQGSNITLDGNKIDQIDVDVKALLYQAAN